MLLCRFPARAVDTPLASASSLPAVNGRRTVDRSHCFAHALPLGSGSRIVILHRRDIPNRRPLRLADLLDRPQFLGNALTGALFQSAVPRSAPLARRMDRLEGRRSELLLALRRIVSSDGWR